LAQINQAVFEEWLGILALKFAALLVQSERHGLEERVRHDMQLVFLAVEAEDDAPGFPALLLYCK
jgi:hypothetical protein